MKVHEYFLIAAGLALVLAFAVFAYSQEVPPRGPHILVARPGPMSKTNIIQFYGNSVFKIRLEMAERYAATGDSPETSLRKADDFVRALQAEDRKEVYERFR
jgi:hypothetical protein